MAYLLVLKFSTDLKPKHWDTCSYESPKCLTSAHKKHSRSVWLHQKRASSLYLPKKSHVVELNPLDDRALESAMIQRMDTWLMTGYTWTTGDREHKKNRGHPTLIQLESRWPCFTKYVPLLSNTSWWPPSLSSLAAGFPIHQPWPSWSSAGPASPWQFCASPVPGLAFRIRRWPGTRCHRPPGTGLGGERKWYSACRPSQAITEVEY